MTITVHIFDVVNRFFYERRYNRADWTRLYPEIAMNLENPAIEQLPPRISFSDVSGILRRNSGGEPLAVSLLRFRRSRIFAEAALLGLLLLARRRGQDVHVHLDVDLPPYEPNTSNRMWKIFLESVSGFMLAQFADVVLDGRGRDVAAGIRREQTAVLNSEGGLVGSGREVAAPIIDRYGSPSAAGVIGDANITAFGHRLVRILSHRLGLDVVRSAAIENLCAFSQELLQNTRDHALLDLDGQTIEGLRFFAARRINPDQESLEELSGTEHDVGAKYLTLLRSYLGGNHQSAGHLVEVTVADSGIGIPARMSGSMRVYEGDISAERAHLLRALELGGSSKPAFVTGRGLGLSKVVDAVASLKGLLVLRTGRLQMFYSPLIDDSEQKRERQFNWLESAEPLFIPGTSVSLLFPWRIAMGQPSLFEGMFDEGGGR